MEGIGSVAVIGVGKMGEIMAAGMVQAGLAPGDIRVADVNREQAGRVAKAHGLHLCEDNLQAVDGARVVLLAVKPQVVPEVLGDLGPALDESHLVISIAAGVSTSSLEAALPTAARVVRAMPNVAAQVGRGVTAICPGTRAGEAQMAQAEKLLSGVGKVIRIAESYMDAVTAVSGSGPAYFALVAEAMTDAAVTAGLPRATADELVAQTILGAAHLLTDGGMAPGALREAVMSPAGTTAMGIRELERGGVRAAVLNAVQAAMDRSAGMAGPSRTIR
ncbi:MAG: pyrroline-5-carboxylate reductase [Actinomycetota bacterium]